jgi:hypothetical protein
LERITSPGLAACGRISQAGLCGSIIGVHQWAGYGAAKLYTIKAARSKFILSKEHNHVGGF